MGCWNETCMATNLPIMIDEPCAAVLLIGAAYPDNSCYPTHDYVPVAIMHGKYDEYGSLNDIQDESKLTPLLRVLPQLYERQDGKYQPFETKFENIQQLIQVLMRKKLFIRNNKGVMPNANGWLPVKIAFIKTGVLDLAKNAECYDYYKHWLKELENARNQKPAKQDDLLTFEQQFRTTECGRQLADIIVCSHANPAMKDIFAQLGEILDIKLFKAMATQLIDLTSFFLHTRIAWHVPSGSGSQDGITDEQLALQKFRLQETKRILNEQDD